MSTVFSVPVAGSMAKAVTFVALPWVVYRNRSVGSNARKVGLIGMAFGEVGVSGLASSASTSWICSHPPRVTRQTEMPRPTELNVLVVRLPT